MHDSLGRCATQDIVQRHNELFDTGFFQLVPQSLRGEIAAIDITDDKGKVIVEQGRRITARSPCSPR